MLRIVHRLFAPPGEKSDLIMVYFFCRIHRFGDSEEWEIFAHVV